MPLTVRYRFLTGPTASGKSAWLLRRAQRMPLAVIAADSRQVYRHMEIGTGRVPAAERNGVQHYGIDCVEPDVAYSAYHYQRDAAGWFAALVGFDGEVWVSGGTGLYIRALFEKLPLGVEPQPELRALLEDYVAIHGSRALAERAGLEVMDPDNPRRVIRAAELATQESTTLAQLENVVGALPERRLPPDSPIAHSPVVGWECIGLAVLDPGREELVQRIEQRVRTMFAAGLLDETRELVRLGFAECPVVAGGIGYRECLAVLSSTLAVEDAIQSTIVRTRQYAKRQRTYFRGRGWPAFAENELPFD